MNHTLQHLSSQCQLILLCGAVCLLANIEEKSIPISYKKHSKTNLRVLKATVFSFCFFLFENRRSFFLWDYPFFFIFFYTDCWWSRAVGRNHRPEQYTGDNRGDYAARRSLHASSERPQKLSTTHISLVCNRYGHARLFAGLSKVKLQFFEQLFHPYPNRDAATPGLLSCDLSGLGHEPCAVLVRALLWWWQCRPGLCGGDKVPRRSWFCRLEEADRSVHEYLLHRVCTASGPGVLFQSECLQRGGTRPARTSFTIG